MTVIAASAPLQSSARVGRPSRRRTYTPKQFLALENDEGRGYLYELDADGHLEKRQMGHESDAIALAFGAALYAHAQGRGYAFGGGTGLQIFPDRPLRIPRCDAAYISKQRLPHPVRGHLQVAPELVVEVVSPRDNAVALETKVQEYLAAGVLRVWIAYPEQRTVTIRRPDGTSTVLGADDEITGEEAAPGFSAPVSSFFPE